MSGGIIEAQFARPVDLYFLLEPDGAITLAQMNMRVLPSGVLWRVEADGEALSIHAALDEALVAAADHVLPGAGFALMLIDGTLILRPGKVDLEDILEGFGYRRIEGKATAFVNMAFPLGIDAEEAQARALAGVPADLQQMFETISHVEEDVWCASFIIPVCGYLNQGGLEYLVRMMLEELPVIHIEVDERNAMEMPLAQGQIC